MPVVPEYHMKGTKAMRNHVVTKTVMFALVALAGVSLSGFLLPVQQQSDQFARAGSQTCPHDDSGLTLPTGFCATVFVDGIGHARHMVVAANGVLYVNTWSGRYYGNDIPHAGGFLVALQDKNGAGRANVIERFGETVQTGGDGGTGIGTYKGAIYAEINDRIVRYSLSANSIVSSGHGETIVSGLPLSGDHPMHPFIISVNGTMYVDVATPTNSCQVRNRMLESPGLNPCPELNTRGGIWRYDANKTNQTFSPAERYATGIRNAEGFATEPNGKYL
jgi:glucose/arabinose dehydrogenase